MKLTGLQEFLRIEDRNVKKYIKEERDAEIRRESQTIFGL